MPPVQIVEAFETMDTEGSATTIICASLDVACGQNALFWMIARTFHVPIDEKQQLLGAVVEPPPPQSFQVELLGA